jgi:hypothetical protein
MQDECYRYSLSSGARTAHLSSLWTSGYVLPFALIVYNQQRIFSSPRVIEGCFLSVASCDARKDSCSIIASTSLLSITACVNSFKAWASAVSPVSIRAERSGTMTLTFREQVVGLERFRSSWESDYPSLELFDYLITRSALANTFGGIVSPICFAVLRLIMNSNFFGSSTGKSAGLAPFRILST